MRSLRRTLYALLPLVLAALVGCGGGAGDAADGDRLRGTIRIDGSSTVYPITEAVAEEFMAQHPGVRVTVGVSGTGGGFSKFVRDETDISNASRPIRSSEAELAERNGIAYIELPVAYDGLAVIVNPQNTWAECLTTEELRRMWETGSTLSRWSEVRPGFPDRPLNLYGPGTDSGTYDYFTAALLGEEGASRADFTASEDDNVLVQGVGGDVNALGFFGLAYYEENQDRLKLVGVDAGSGCVRPTTDSVNDGSYQPLSRPEFIYVNAARVGDPVIDAFVDFYLDNADALVREVGYVPLSAEAYDLARDRYRQRVAGSLFGGEGSQVGLRIDDLLRQGRAGVEGPAQPDAPEGAPADTAAAPVAN